MIGKRDLMITRNISCFAQKKRETIIRISSMLFCMYSLLMIWEVFIGPYRSYSSERRYNLYPFKTIVHYFINNRQYSSHVLFINLAANIITFIPLGFFTSLLFKRFNKIVVMIVYSIIIITVIESLQFVFNVGVFDIDDIILNTLGCITGAALYNLIKWILYKYRE
jgi:glycopeptide antibiotics resistance protein